MAGPWEQYQAQGQAPAQSGPWSNYSTSGSTGPWSKYGGPNSPDDSQGSSILDTVGQFAKNVGGAALGAADMVSGAITGIPTWLYQEGQVAMGKDPAQAQKDWQETMAKLSPSATAAEISKAFGGSDPRQNQSYQMEMGALGKLNEGIDKAVDLAGGGPGAKLAAEGLAMALPIPFLGKAGRLAQAGLEKIDPGLRDTAPPLPKEPVPPGGTLETSTAPNGDQVQWVEQPPNPQLDFHQPINPYDVGGHVTALEEGRPTQIDVSQPELGGKVEDISTVPTDVQTLADQAKTQEFTQNATQGELFGDEPISMNRAYDQFGPDEFPRALTRDEFEQTVDNLSKQEGTRFQKPEDMDAAYDQYLQDMQGNQGGLFDRPSQQQGFANTLSDEATARMQSAFNLDPRWQALQDNLTDLSRKLDAATNPSVKTRFQNQIKDVESKISDIEDSYKQQSVDFGPGKYSPADLLPGTEIPPNPDIPTPQPSTGPAARVEGQFVPPDVPQPFREATDNIPGFEEFKGDNVPSNPSEPNGVVPAAKAEPIVQAMNQIPGLSEEGKKMIVESRTPEQVIDLAKKDKDGTGSTFAKLLYSGANFAGVIRDSALIRGIHDYMNTAENITRKVLQQRILPVERNLVKIGSQDRMALAQVMKDEMFAGTRMSQEELAARFAGSKNPDRLMQGYRLMRAALDETGKTLNEGRSIVGLDPVPLKDAYVSSMWRGSFKSAAYIDGHLVGYLRDTRARGLAKQKLALEKHFGEAKIEWRDARPNDFREPSDTLQASFLEALKVLDPKDPIVKEFVEAQKEQMQEQAFGSAGVAKHMEPKNNIRGFIGDRFDRTKKANANDLLSAQIRYMKNVAKWTEQQKAVAKAKVVLSDPELKVNQPNNVQYAQEYIKNALGYGTQKNIRDLESLAARGLGMDRDALVSGLQYAKSYFYIKQLGLLNPKATFVQFPQVFFMLPAHAELYSKGFKYNPVTVGLKTVGDYLSVLSKGKLADLSPVAKEAMNYAIDHGILSINVLDDVKNVGDSLLVRKAGQLANINQIKIEQFGRTVSYLSMIHHLDESGLKGEALYKTAEAITDRIMVDYRKFEQPMWMEKGGLVTKAAGTLKNFTNNQYNQLVHYFGEAKKGNLTPLAMFLGTQYVLGGLMGMPGATTITELYDNLIRPMLGPNFADKSLKDFMLEHLSDTTMYGGFSKITGVNMFSSLSQGEIAGADNAMGFFAPFLDDAWKTATATASALRHPTNSEGWQRALYENLPPQGKGIMENMNPAYTSPSGVSISPRNPSKGTYKRNEFDKALRNFGATSLKEFETKEKAYAAKSQETDIAKAKGEYKNRFLSAVRRGSEEDRKAAIMGLSKWMGPQEIASFLATGLRDTQRARLLDSLHQLYPKTFNNVSDLKKVQRINRFRENAQ